MLALQERSQDFLNGGSKIHKRPSVMQLLKFTGSDTLAKGPVNSHYYKSITLDLVQCSLLNITDCAAVPAVY